MVKTTTRYLDPKKFESFDINSNRLYHTFAYFDIKIRQNFKLVTCSSGFEVKNSSFHHS